MAARRRKQFPLRLSPELYDVLERWAQDEFRSVNAQIEALLADAARRSGRWRPPGTRTDDDPPPTGEPDPGEATDPPARPG